MSQEYCLMREIALDIRRDILILSGLSPARLVGIAIELPVDYDVWCAYYPDRVLTNTYVGFCEMISDWTFPISLDFDTALNGLNRAQCLFGWAYFQCQLAYDLLSGTEHIDDLPYQKNADHAGCLLVRAAQAVQAGKTALVPHD